VVESSQIATGHDLFLARARKSFSNEIYSGVLRITYERFYADGEGDAEIMLEGLGLRLHIVRERSFDRVSIAGTKRPKDWHDLNIVLHVVTGCHLPNVDPDTKEISLDGVRTLVQTHAETLSSVFRQPWWRWIGTRRRFEEARRRALDAFLQRPKSEAQKQFERAAQEALENPTPELQAAIKSMEDTNWGKGL
jgi:hypothetical protein